MQLALQRIRVRGRLYALRKLVASDKVSQHLNDRFGADNRLSYELTILAQAALEGTWTVSLKGTAECRLYAALHAYGQSLQGCWTVSGIEERIACSGYGDVDARALEIVCAATLEGVASRFFTNLVSDILSRYAQTERAHAAFSVLPLLWCGDLDTDVLARKIYPAEAELERCCVYLASDKETRLARRYEYERTTKLVHPPTRGKAWISSQTMPSEWVGFAPIGLLSIAFLALLMLNGPTIAALCAALVADMPSS